MAPGIQAKTKEAAAAAAAAATIISPSRHAAAPQPSAAARGRPEVEGEVMVVGHNMAHNRGTTNQAQAQEPRLPPALYFPLVVVLSLALDTLGYSFLAQWSGGELATFARADDGGWLHAAVLTGWQVCELALAWLAGYDSHDVAALSLLSHGPTLYLLSAFYQVRPWTTAAWLSINVLSSLVPFILLRPFLSAAHSAAPAVPNRDVLVDRPITVYTTILASAVYGLTIWSSYRIYLRRTLLLSFEGIPSIEPAHSFPSAAAAGGGGGGLPAAVGSVLTGPNLLAVCLALLFGLASRSFVFAPAAATGRTAEDEDLDSFDATAATLGETMWYNVWGFTAQTRVVIARTLVAMLTTGTRTFLQCVLTIQGVESAGAAAYASAWVAAALLAGTSLGMVMD